MEIHSYKIEKCTSFYIADESGFAMLEINDDKDYGYIYNFFVRNNYGNVDACRKIIKKLEGIIKYNLKRFSEIDIYLPSENTDKIMSILKDMGYKTIGNFYKGRWKRMEKDLKKDYMCI